MSKNFKLESKDNLTQLLKQRNITSWSVLIHYISSLPYGRNTNREDFSLVIKEQKGSCSSKHAVLKTIAELNGIPNIQLILGMYKMNAVNTPKIAEVLKANTIDYIPEAHCYLSIDGIRKDYTSPTSNFEKIKDAILEEQVILPKDVTTYKVDYHKNFLKKWITNSKIPYGFETLWSIREQCIQALSK